VFSGCHFFAFFFGYLTRFLLSVRITIGPPFFPLVAGFLVCGSFFVPTFVTRTQCPLICDGPPWFLFNSAVRGSLPCYVFWFFLLPRFLANPSCSPFICLESVQCSAFFSPFFPGLPPPPPGFFANPGWPSVERLPPFVFIVPSVNG